MPSVTVDIMGRKYTLQASAGREHLLRVAEHLNKRISEAKQADKNANDLSTAVLAALNITNEFIQLRDQQDNLLREIEVKAERLLERIELDHS